MIPSLDRRTVARWSKFRNGVAGFATGPGEVVPWGRGRGSPGAMGLTKMNIRALSELVMGVYGVRSTNVLVRVCSVAAEQGLRRFKLVPKLLVHCENGVNSTSEVTPDSPHKKYGVVSAKASYGG